jgi:hypothetical protein
MQDVTLVELDADGEHLVLTDPAGQRYRLAIDEPLRAAVRRDVAWMNRLQAEEGAALRPREIQARIRAGMSAEDLAAGSGMDLEHIRRYEGPVLAEREHVALRATRTAVARSSKGDTTLGDAVTERLVARGVSDDPVWDSWRDEHHGWVVQAGFDAGGRLRCAQWRFEPAAATLEALDDEARWLSGTPEQPPAPAVRERVYDVDADGAVHEVPPVIVTDATGAATLDPQARTLDLLEALRGRRGRRQPVDDELLGEQTDLVDALLDDDEPPPAHPPVSRPDLATDAAILPMPTPSSPAPSAPEAAPRDGGATRTRTKPKSKRATVPRWDDIVFGTKRD